MFRRIIKHNVPLLFATCLSIAVGIFVADLKLELGVAAGIPYIAVVGLAFLSRSKRVVISAASAVSILVVAGFVFSPPGGDHWKVIANRALALISIWAVAGLCAYALRLVELLNVEKSQLQVVYEASPVGMVMVNEQGLIQLVNQATEQLFGYKRDELIGQPIEIFVPERYRAKHPEHRRRFNLDSSARPMGVFGSIFGRHQSGVEIPVDIGLTPVECDSELCVLSTIIDLREQKRAERELQKYADQLARANEDLEQFAYIASHDLKSPLRAIDNLSKWIVEDVGDGLPEQSRKHLLQLQGRVLRMESLLDDLLDYSRAGRTVDDIEFFECSLLMQEILETLNIPEGFQLEISENLPSLHGRKSALRQVLMNLVSNAIKHHDRSDGRVTLQVSESDSELEFTIEDDGPGIASEFHERAFMPFRTLQSRDKVDGSGLGLSIVRRLVENEGGSIQLTSDEGQGAHFRITWPKKSSSSHIGATLA